MSAEDRAIWERVAATTKPLDRRVKNMGVAQDQIPAKVKPKATNLIGSFRIGEAMSPVQNQYLAPSVSERVNQAPVRMHHGTHKKMVKGKLTPEARIDLHGLTIASAHPQLTRFILDAHSRGKRLVLVITGKGRHNDDDGPIPIRRGILRHQVPAWLTAPPLGSIVLDIRTAHVKHGGEGAYYVYLKRQR